MRALLLALLLAPAARASDMNQPGTGPGTAVAASTLTISGAGTACFTAGALSINCASGSVTASSVTASGGGLFGTAKIGPAGNIGSLLLGDNGDVNSVTGFASYKAATDLYVRPGIGYQLNLNDIAAPGNTIINKQGGNVGIGTASPCSTCTLHVAGGASVAGNLSVDTRVAISTTVSGNGSLRVRAGTGMGGGSTPVVLFSWVGSSTTQGHAGGTMVGHSVTIPANTIVNDGDTIQVFCLAKATTTSTSKILSVTVDGDQDGTGTSTNVARQWTNKSSITKYSTNLIHHAERERGDPAGTQGQSVDIDYVNAVNFAADFNISCDIRADAGLTNTAPGDEVMDLREMIVTFIPAP